MSLSILVGQIGHFVKVKIGPTGLPPLVEIAGKRTDPAWPSLLLGLFMFALLWLVRAFQLKILGRSWSSSSVVLSAVFDFQGRGISVVGDIPSGLPNFSLPLLHQMPKLDKIILGSAAIFLVSFGAGKRSGSASGSRTGEEVDANQELIGLGANIAPGLRLVPDQRLGSRTAINLSTGGVSQAAGLRRLQR